VLACCEKQHVCSSIIPRARTAAKERAAMTYQPATVLSVGGGGGADKERAAMTYQAENPGKIFDIRLRLLLIIID
jgi:hypothetical protein